MAEVEAGEQGHMADDQAQRGVRDVQPGKPEIDHVAEFAAIVLTCTGTGRNKEWADCPWGPSPGPAQPASGQQQQQQLTGFVCWRRE